MISVKAQEKASHDSISKVSPNIGILRFGLNGGFFFPDEISWFKYIGPTMYCEFTFPEKSLVAVTPRAFGSFVREIYKTDEGITDYYSSTAIGLSLAATISPNEKLSIDAGMVWFNMNSTQATISQGYSVSSFNEKFRGLFASVSKDFIKNSRIESGLRLDIITNLELKDFKCRSVQLGLYLGIKL